MFSDADISRFWALVKWGADDECWPWQGKVAWNGYGKFNANGRRYTASRVALQLGIGRALLKGEMACHHCDNRPCCNPAHLFVGNDAINRADCVAKGRAHVLNGGNVGSANPRAKLTDEQVSEIRSLKGSLFQKDVAARYGVSRQTVSAIQNGDRWSAQSAIAQPSSSQSLSNGPTQ